MVSVGIVVFELVEAEADTAEEALRLGERLGMLAEQPRHFLGRLDVPLGIGFEPAAGLDDGQVLADAGHHILQHAPAAARDRARR